MAARRMSAIHVRTIMTDSDATKGRPQTVLNG